MTPRKLLLVSLAGGALAATGVVATGCGASATVDPVAQAAEATQQLPGAQLRFTERLSGAALTQPVAITGAGFINQRQRSGQLEFDFSQIPGASALRSDKTALLVFQSSVVYAKIGFLSGKLPGGKPWIKIDLQKAGQAAGIDLSQLASAGGSDPSQYLSYLRATGSVTKVGSETVNGAATTHYRAVIDLNRVVDRLPPSQRAAVQTGVAQLEKAAGTSSLPVDTWIDAQRRVRRVQFALHLNTLGAGGAVNGLITVDFLSFGPTPAVTAPPASDVYDASAVAAAGLKKAGG